MVKTPPPSEEKGPPSLRSPAHGPRPSPSKVCEANGAFPGRRSTAADESSGVICIEVGPQERSQPFPERASFASSPPPPAVERTPLPLPASFLAVLPPSFLTSAPSLLQPSVPPEFRIQMLPKRRRVRPESPDRAGASSAPPPVRFPGVAIYLAEPRMGRSRRAFLARLARSKGFRILDTYRCAAPAGARCWWGASLAGGWCKPATLGYGPIVARGGRWFAAADGSTCGFGT